MDTDLSALGNAYSDVSTVVQLVSDPNSHGRTPACIDRLSCILHARQMGVMMHAFVGTTIRLRDRYSKTENIATILPHDHMLSCTSPILGEEKYSRVRHGPSRLAGMTGHDCQHSTRIQPRCTFLALGQALHSTLRMPGRPCKGVRGLTETQTL